MPIPAKICGLTRSQDAEFAIKHGAAWLGVIFAGGPRQVTLAQAQAVVGVAGQARVFGVFSSQTREEILEVRDQTGLTGAQLHGEPDQALMEALILDGMQVLMVARLADESELPKLDLARQLAVPALVEPRVVGRLGGTGAQLSYLLARAARERLMGHPMFLAGGLTPDTVAEAVRQVGPDAVDVASGVEQIPGIKDHDKLARFMEVLRWL